MPIRASSVDEIITEDDVLGPMVEEQGGTEASRDSDS